MFEIQSFNTQTQQAVLHKAVKIYKAAHSCKDFSDYEGSIWTLLLQPVASCCLVHFVYMSRKGDSVPCRELAQFLFTSLAMRGYDVSRLIDREQF